MIVSEKTLKWALCLYPPFLFQRIWVKKFHDGFLGVDVKITNSFLNRNYNGSIFGGSIYAATDPFYALLFDQLMQRRGFKVRVWLKSASIQYLKPGLTSLHFTLKITDEMIAEAENALTETGKFVKSYPMELYNLKGELCATAMNEIYLRYKFPDEKQHVAI
ncbi:MAG: YiiD C-terminal domain-containing protein [Pedobacter sp.]|nr:YiiD C-terminal domain-containing protein [Pedobacter sp.]